MNSAVNRGGVGQTGGRGQTGYVPGAQKGANRGGLGQTGASRGGVGQTGAHGQAGNLNGGAYYRGPNSVKGESKHIPQRGGADNPNALAQVGNRGGVGPNQRRDLERPGPGLHPNGREQDARLLARAEDIPDEPVEEVVSTADGCSPRIDRAQKKVVIQEKTVTYRDGQIVKQGQCYDTFDQYEIHRDYLCEDCGVHLDNVRKQAFDKYKAYWIDDRGEKHVLDNEPKIDIENPHPFIEETSTCQYQVSLNKAYPQVETVFYDRFNARRVASACHRQLEAEGIDLQVEACELEHDRVLNASFKRQKKLFVDAQGVTHQVRACEQVGTPIRHEFIVTYHSY